jgi:hypothetical protein
MSQPESNSVPADTHLIEVRQESYGFTLVHRVNGKVLYFANYENRMEAMRNARRRVEMEEAEGHNVMLLADARLG